MKPSLVLALALLGTSAYAHPPPGAHPTADEHAWWECFHPLNDKHNCCDEADGFALSQDNWRQVPDVVGQPMDLPKGWTVKPGYVKSGYQIRIDVHGNPGGGEGATWWDISQFSLIGFEAKNCGLDPKSPADAHVWISRNWMGGKLTFVWAFCFIAGTVE